MDLRFVQCTCTRMSVYGFAQNHMPSIFSKWNFILILRTSWKKNVHAKYGKYERNKRRKKKHKRVWLIKEVRVYLRTYIAYISRRSHHFYISQTHWREESASGSFDVAANSVCWTVWVCCGISRSSYLPLSLSLSLTSCSTVTASYSARRSANDHPSRTNLRSDDANDSGLAHPYVN